MHDYPRDSFYRIGWNLSRCVFDLCFPVESHGQENLPTRGAYIIAANHLSYLDPPAIGVCIDHDLSYFARKSLFKGPFNRILRRVHAIPVDRDGSDIQAMKEALRTLARGLPLVLFPEGRRSDDGNLQPAKRGIGLLSLKAGVPVVPCRIFNSGSAWGRNRPPCLGTRIEVRFGTPVSPEALKREARKEPDLYQGAADRIMRAIAEIGGPAEPAPSDGH